MTPHSFVDLQGFGKAAVSSETLVVDTNTTIWCHYPEYHDFNFPHHGNLKFNAKSQLQNAFPLSIKASIFQPLFIHSLFKLKTKASSAETLYFCNLYDNCTQTTSFPNYISYPHEELAFT
jgi:hypothetical protein